MLKASHRVSFNSDRGNAEATMNADTVAGVIPSKGWVSTDGGADAQGGANGSITNGVTVDRAQRHLEHQQRWWQW